LDSLCEINTGKKGCKYEKCVADQNAVISKGSRGETWVKAKDDMMDGWMDGWMDIIINDEIERG
jgi:hypothetical protein